MRIKNALVRTLSLFMVLSLLLSLVGCGNIVSDNYFSQTFEDTNNKYSGETAANDTAHVSGNYLSVHIVDVGQGLGVLFGFHNDDGTVNWMLLDGGDAKHTSNLVSFMSKQKVSTLDSLFVTHYHADHINGSVAAVVKYGLSDVYLPNYSVIDRKIYTTFNAAINLCNIYMPSCGDTFLLGDAVVTVLSTDHPENYADENNKSIGVKVTYGETSVMCLGDMEKEAEYDMIDLATAKGIELTSEIYIAGHHGSSSSTTEQLMKHIHSEKFNYSVISSGTGNEYGHPHQSTMDRLSEYGYSVWRTDKQGDISFNINSDGSVVCGQESTLDLSAGK